MRRRPLMPMSHNPSPPQLSDMPELSDWVRATWRVLGLAVPTALITGYVVSTNADRQLEVELARKDAELAEIVARRNAKLARKDAELAQLDRELAEISTTPSAAETDRKLAELNRELAELRVRLGDVD